MSVRFTFPFSLYVSVHNTDFTHNMRCSVSTVPYLIM
jgi:hypothetical protein